MKQFAAFDIDGTIIRWQLYHSIVNELAKTGHLNDDAYDKIRESRMQWKYRKHEHSYKEYERAIVTAYHSAITQLDIPTYLRVVDTVFEEHKDQVYTFSRDLISSLKKQGYLLFAISGSQHEIVEKLADYYGFDDAVGNSYERQRGYFTGKRQNIVENKDQILRSLVEKHGCSYKKSIAVGDSESDISMLELVDDPIAFNPTKGLLSHAKEHNWRVVVERKNVVYELRPKKNSYLLTEGR